jgi:hypothetical protein
VSKHKGLRLSAIGALICILSLPLLSIMPRGIPSLGILVGGLLVWGGLMWTLFGYYAAPHEPTPPP